MNEGGKATERTHSIKGEGKGSKERERESLYRGLGRRDGEKATETVSKYGGKASLRKCLISGIERGREGSKRMSIEIRAREGRLQERVGI